MSRHYGNRWCVHWPCTTNGGAHYMDPHEKLEHGACACGWYGAVKNFNQHVGQRVRHSALDEMTERFQHMVIYTGPSRHTIG